MNSGKTDENAGSSSARHERGDNVRDFAPEVSASVAEAVGQALRAHFQAIAEMPLPDRLLVLLAEFETSEHKL